MVSGLRGLSKLALDSLSSLVSSSLSTAKSHRKNLRQRSLKIKEEPLKSELIDKDPWAPSLFSPNTSSVVLESAKTPAARQISINSNYSKANKDSRFLNLAKLGKLKAQRGRPSRGAPYDTSRNFVPNRTPFSQLDRNLVNSGSYRRGSSSNRHFQGNLPANFRSFPQQLQGSSQENRVQVPVPNSYDTTANRDSRSHSFRAPRGKSRSARGKPRTH